MGSSARLKILFYRIPMTPIRMLYDLSELFYLMCVKTRYVTSVKNGGKMAFPSLEAISQLRGRFLLAKFDFSARAARIDKITISSPQFG
jgi:hypothetical protein